MKRERQLFGTDGIRGRANEFPITPELAMRLGRGLARIFKQRKKRRVIIGKDTRLSGYMLENAISAGLVSEGMEVLLTGPLPTPAIAYLTRSMNCVAGVMLTASHNPYEDNGIKVFGSDGYKLNDALELELESILLSPEIDMPDPEQPLGKAYRIDDARGRYIEYLKSSQEFKGLAGIKLVLDAANGAAYSVAPEVLRELGAEVEVIGSEPNGRNINAGCGALYPELAGAKVREIGADLGICLDGDGDRIILVDERGDVVSGDRSIALIAKSLKAEGTLPGNAVVATVMSNLGLRDTLAEHGIELEITDVGDRQVLEHMRAMGYGFGGENSGHLIFRDLATTGDGLLSALRVLVILKKSGRTLSDLASEMNEYPQLLESLAVNEKLPIDQVAPLKKAITISEKELGQDGRVLVRYSGTEKKIRLLVEAKNQSLADRVMARLKNGVESGLGLATA